MPKEPERISRRRNSRLLINDLKSTKVLDSIIEYAQEPLLSLAEACEPLVDIVDNILKYAATALDSTPADPPNNLTRDEAASIHLYTMEWEDGHKSLYSVLNHTLRAGDPQDLKPWFKYLKLFLTGLVKIPCAPKQTVWRGVRRNVSDEFPPGTQVTWWSFSSCTTALTVLESDMYLGNVGDRTLFSIELCNGRIIRDYSHFDIEDEILMLPGTRLEVQSQFSPAPDLHIIHLKQIKPKEILLEVPFKGACLYPKNERPWYRKKRFSILIIIFLTIISLGSILGSKFANQMSVLLSVKVINVTANSSSRFISDQLKLGQTYSSMITGHAEGTIHGTNIYTDDSNLAAAAVHAGVLRIGETKNVTIKILPGLSFYIGSQQNGISSSSFENWGRSYIFVDISLISNVTLSSFAGYGYSIGETLSVAVTGTIDKYIYGTNIYTDDCNFGTAAVHAGILRVGETKNVMIMILPGQPSYVGSTQNGISSYSYSAWGRSYLFIDTATTSNVTLSSFADYEDSIGKTLFVVITGTIDKYIYGTNIYTDDSNFGTAAVHAGILRKGETKNVTIKILPGQSSYITSTQNGILSYSYGLWRRSYSFINVTE